MKTFTLIDITSETVPELNIKKTINCTSAKKASLIFMAMAFAGKKGKIDATIRVQNNIGNTKLLNIKRRPIITNSQVKYKHYIA